MSDQINAHMRKQVRGYIRNLVETWDTLDFKERRTQERSFYNSIAVPDIRRELLKSADVVYRCEAHGCFMAAVWADTLVEHVLAYSASRVVIEPDEGRLGGDDRWGLSWYDYDIDLETVGYSASTSLSADYDRHEYHPEVDGGAVLGADFKTHVDAGGRFYRTIGRDRELFSVSPGRAWFSDDTTGLIACPHSDISLKAPSSRWVAAEIKKARLSSSNVFRV